MGGVKNKLSNKVKNLLINNRSLPLDGEGAARSATDEVTNKVPLWLKGNVRRQSDKGIVLTKYLGIACLTLAVLSILILNIISSYSYSKVNSNAEPVGEVSTSANEDCDPSNTNAASCISMSISSYPSATGDTNDGNLSLSIPQGGGLVAGRHTVSIKSNNVSGIELQAEALDSKTSYPPMVHENDGDYTIDSLPYDTSSTNSISYSTSRPITNNTYGLAIPGSSIYGGNYDNASIYESYITNPRRVASTEAAPKFAGPYNATAHSEPVARTVFLDYPRIDKTTQPTPVDGYNLNIYYGVRVDNPNELLAGNYQAEVVYTATTNEVSIPTIDTLSQNSYELGSDTNLDSNNRLPVTIIGTNLKSTYRAYLVSNADTNIQYDLTSYITDIDTTTGRSLTITLPTDITNSDLESGEYTIHVVTQGGEGTIGFTYTEKQLPDGMLQSTADYGSDGHVAVDYDENMIPIAYIGNETTPKWVIADASNGNSDTNLNWYDYPNKKWANAVTLTEEGLSLYRGKPVGTEIDEQYVLGYWVYIPRYAYEVMRPNAVDRVVAAQNFDIKFEVASDTKKVPAASCNLNIISMSQMWKSGHATHAGPTSSEILAKDYRSSCGIERDYPGDNDALANKTTWATHPAFTWQYTTEVNGFDKTVELNGIWIGKFETTGGETSPTILPNHPHIGEGDGMGRFFGIAKNIGYPDELNKYGDDVSTKANSHNFSTQSTHMTKNGEYAAAAYLSASKFGAGVNQVQINSQYADMTDDDGNESKGITGCGPSKSWNWSHYADTGIVGQNSACSKSNSKRAYNGSIGMLASSTGNVYGVYDMVGGGYDVVSAAWTNAPNEYLGTTFKGGVRPPYIDLYESSTFKATGAMWSLTRNDTGSYVYNDFDVCTWDTCGGKAMHEVKTVQSINGRNYTWGWEDSGDNDFPCKRYPILVFGLGAGDGSQDGPGAGVSIFATSTDYSVTFYLYAFRVTSISPVV